MERLALRVMQLGAIAIVIAATTHREFDLDRFLVPKELVLHVTAAVAGLLTLRAARRFTMVDGLLVAYLLLSVVAAVFATNPWLAIRAVAVSASGIVLFWSARALRDAGLARPLLGTLAFAVVLAAAMALLQAYGIWLDLFSINRAPGGTLGNRNFVAHAAAFGMPVVLLAALQALRRWTYLLAGAGVTIVTAALVLTRSRAAWLAFGAMAAVFLAAMLITRSTAPLSRAFGLVIFAGAGVAAALLLPNELRWRSDNPYLESVAGVVNYQEGSGRGRLIQYQRSLRMAADSPVVGVGPGNWAVSYPEHATRRDPSMDPSEPGMTFNPWPSSDWVAFASERGFAAAIVMAAVFVLLALGGLRALRTEHALTAAAVVATVVAAGVAGAFDAVLLLALPAFLVWTALGALGVPVPPAPKSLGTAGVTLLAIAISFFGAARSVAQIASMEAFTSYDSRASLRWAARIDPGNYRLQLRLARSGKRAERCEHARAAYALYPNADAARDLSKACGD